MQIQTSNAILVYNQTQWAKKKTTKDQGWQRWRAIRLLYMVGVHKNGYNHLGKLGYSIY